MKLLRTAQKETVISMLNLNSKTSSSNGGDTNANAPIWKILIYDKMGQDIISPLMKVGELREQGVTVHMNIHADRQPIPDVPAVYFLQPTEANIRKLAEDFSRKLYETYYINFCYALPRSLLEELASHAVTYNVIAQIGQVFDQYLNYICLESALFTVNMDEAYFNLNNPQSKDTDIEKYISDMVSSLFSVIITLDIMPIIRSPKGNAAEMVATKLETKLRDHYINSTKGTTGPIQKDLAPINRPLVVILERAFDLTSMLSHSWTYSTMVHDVLNMNMNRVTITAENGSTQKVDIDINDFFWKKNSVEPFPQVAEEVNNEIVRYKQDVEKVTRSCGVNSLEEVGESTTNLKLAITAMPELTERKRIIDMHMNLSMNLLNTVKSRQLDVFFSMEESIQKQTKQAILEQLKDVTKSQEDKLRLALIYYLALSDNAPDAFKDIEETLKAAGIDTGALRYVKSIKSYLKLTNPSGQSQSHSGSGGGSTTSDLFGKFTSISNKLTDHLEKAGMGGGLESFMSSVKNLLPSRNELPVTNIVKSLMENKGSESEEYLFLDPKVVKKGSPSRSMKASQNYAEAIVFIVGGGNYLEYQNLSEFMKNNEGKRTIIYGASDIISPKAFLNELTKLSSTLPAN